MVRSPEGDGSLGAMAAEKLTNVVSARFTATETERLKTLASGRPVAQLLRELALAAIDQESPEHKSPAPSSLTESHAQATWTAVSNFPRISAPGIGATGWVTPPNVVTSGRA